MNADTITDLVTTIYYGMSLETMIATGKYDWTNPNITVDKFSIDDGGVKKFHNKLFHFDRDILSEDAMAAIEGEDFAPATHVHGLAFGATFPDEQQKYPIVCLGSSAQVHGCRRVVCLSGTVPSAASASAAGTAAGTAIGVSSASKNSPALDAGTLPLNTGHFVPRPARTLRRAFYARSL